MALNVDMDLRPFQAINPCGYAGMAVTQISHFVPDCSVDAVGEALLLRLQQQL
jgi:lipoyl(octanoyl) transferase